MGDIADEHALALWDIDQMDDDYIHQPTPKTCRYCGRKELHWEQRKDKWRLCDGRGVHRCPVKPLKLTCLR